MRRSRARDVICFSCIVVHFRIRTLPLSRNPFTHVGRTVFKFDSARLRKAKNLDRFVTHQSDLCEINRHSFRCLVFVCQFPQRLHVRTVNASTHAQDAKAIRSKNSFNFAGHRVPRFKLVARLATFILRWSPARNRVARYPAAVEAEGSDCDQTGTSAPSATATRSFFANEHPAGCSLLCASLTSIFLLSLCLRLLNKLP